MTVRPGTSSGCPAAGRGRDAVRFGWHGGPRSHTPAPPPALLRAGGAVVPGAGPPSPPGRPGAPACAGPRRGPGTRFCTSRRPGPAHRPTGRPPEIRPSKRPGTMRHLCRSFRWPFFRLTWTDFRPDRTEKNHRHGVDLRKRAPLISPPNKFFSLPHHRPHGRGGRGGPPDERRGERRRLRRNDTGLLAAAPARPRSAGRLLIARFRRLRPRDAPAPPPDSTGY